MYGVISNNYLTVFNGCYDVSTSDTAHAYAVLRIKLIFYLVSV